VVSAVVLVEFCYYKPDCLVFQVYESSSPHSPPCNFSEMDADDSLKKSICILQLLIFVSFIPIAATPANAAVFTYITASTSAVLNNTIRLKNLFIFASLLFKLYFLICIIPYHSELHCMINGIFICCGSSSFIN